MGRMATLLGISLAGLLVATMGPARAEDPAAAKPPSVDPVQARPKMDELLDRWEAEVGRLTSMSVGFTRVDKSQYWGNDEYRGQLYLKGPDRACVHFQKVDRGGPKATQTIDHERLTWNGKELRQYSYRTQRIFAFPIDTRGGRSLTAIWPPAYLFSPRGRAGELRDLYDFTLLNENETAYLIAITPRGTASFPAQAQILGIPLKINIGIPTFRRGFVQLNKKTFLPDRILLVDESDKDTQDYSFHRIEPNREIAPEFFEPLVIKGWKVIENPAPRP